MRLYAAGSASTVRQIIDHGFLAEPIETLKLSGLGGAIEDVEVTPAELTAGALEFAVDPVRLRHHTAVLPGSLPFVISLDIPDTKLGEEVMEEDQPTGLYWVRAHTANAYRHTLCVLDDDGNEVPPYLVGK